MVHGATVVHHIPGRLRVRLPRASRDPRVLAELREFVSGLGGVRQVEINPVTGSILVHYHPESREQIQSLISRGNGSMDAPPELTGVDDLAENIEKEAEFLAGHSTLAFHVVNAVKALNREVRDATDNTIDLKVLLPAGLAVWAFFKAGAEISTPLWVTLAIFSFNSFVALHHPTTVHVTRHYTNIDQPAP
jgi:Heavy metal associated domain 2